MTTRNDVINVLIGSQFTTSSGIGGVFVLNGDLPALAADLLAALTKTDDGAVEPPATPRAVPNPAAQAGEASWRPAPSSPKPDGGAASPPADPTGVAPPSAAESATPKAAPPSVLPRPFLLFRTRDITGLSGTGIVAWGVEFPDGSAALRWNTAHPSTAAWPSVEDILAVHGHQGATVIRWLDNREEA